MPHIRGLADGFGDSVNARAGAVVGIAAPVCNREDESAALSPLPDRREVFAGEGPKDDFGSRPSRSTQRTPVIGSTISIATSR
jgi:hypothetical protein